MTLYQITTYPRAMHLTGRDEVHKTTTTSLALYQRDKIEVPQKEPVPGLKVYTYPKAFDRSKVYESFFTQSNDNRKPVDENKIPDFWVTNPIPTVTQRCRDLIEELDPGVHQFVPIEVYCKKTKKRREATNYYSFICGRLLTIKPHDEVLPPEHTDVFLSFGGYFMGETGELLSKTLHAIYDNPSIQEAISAFPVWHFANGSQDGFKSIGSYGQYFINERFLKTAQQRGFRGFKETSGKIVRDVHHVWY